MRARLFFSVWSVESRKLMGYRVDFWFTTVAAFAVELVLAWSLWSAIFAATGADRIGGFTPEGMVAYYVLAILLGRLVRGQDRGPDASQDIYEGHLSRYLMYPVPYVGVKYAEHLGALTPGLIQLFLLGGALALVHGSPADSVITLSAVLRCGVALALANLLWFLMNFPVQCVAFWADNVWTLRVMLRFVSAFLGGLFLPPMLFPETFRAILYFTPFPYLFAVPVTQLLGIEGGPPFTQGCLVCLAWSGIFAVAGVVVWRRGLRSYAGVGM